MPTVTPSVKKDCFQGAVLKILIKINHIMYTLFNNKNVNVIEKETAKVYTYNYNYLLSLGKRVFQVFMFFFSAANGFFVQILLSVSSSSMMCQFVLSILPICMVLL